MKCEVIPISNHPRWKWHASPTFILHGDDSTTATFTLYSDWRERLEAAAAK